MAVYKILIPYSLALDMAPFLLRQRNLLRNIKVLNLYPYPQPVDKAPSGVLREAQFLATNMARRESDLAFSH